MEQQILHLRDLLTRKARAEARYIFILLKAFRFSVAAFVVLLVAGTAILKGSFDPAHGPGFTGWFHAFNTTFSLIFLDHDLPRYPDYLAGQIAEFVIPPIGICIVVEGFVRFGVLYFNRSLNMKEWNTAIASSYKGHVVLGGLGRIGYRIVDRLARDPRQKIVVIEKDPESQFFDEIRALEVPFLVGDVTHIDVLRRANVEQAAVVICATNNDLANIEMALNAREMAPKARIVLRMFNDRMAHRITEAVKIGTVFSTSALSAPAFAAACYSDRIIGSIDADGTVLHSARIRVEGPSGVDGLTIRDIEDRTGVLCILHSRASSQGVRPPKDLAVKAGDHLVILGDIGEILGAEAWLGGGAPPRRPLPVAPPPPVVPPAPVAMPVPVAAPTASVAAPAPSPVAAPREPAAPAGAALTSPAVAVAVAKAPAPPPQAEAPSPAAACTDSGAKDSP